MCVKQKKDHGLNKSSFINLICPISDKKINENIARISASLVMVIAGLGIYFNSAYVFLFLAVDFALRAFTNGGFSPVKQTSQLLIKLLDIKYKPLDEAQKKFSAELGLILCTAGFILLLSGYSLIAAMLGLLLVLFAFLESVFKFCIGCVIYTYIAMPFFRNK